jgi:GNAT superfamily N-acetyltransferase
LSETQSIEQFGMSQPITIYYLEMLSPEKLNFKANRDPNFEICECQIRQYSINRFLYSFVGSTWGWVDKLQWSDEQWQAYAENDNLRMWIAYLQGSPAGYYELQYQAGNCVEIAYFGLAYRFIGLGHGGYLLSHAVRSAWEWGAKRVWVHTCSLDHLAALANYRARGFSLYREEVTL